MPGCHCESTDKSTFLKITIPIEAPVGHCWSVEKVFVLLHPEEIARVLRKPNIPPKLLVVPTGRDLGSYLQNFVLNISFYTLFGHFDKSKPIAQDVKFSSLSFETVVQSAISMPINLPLLLLKFSTKETVKIVVDSNSDSLLENGTLPSNGICSIKFSDPKSNTLFTLATNYQAQAHTKQNQEILSFDLTFEMLRIVPSGDDYGIRVKIPGNISFHVSKSPKESFLEFSNLSVLIPLLVLNDFYRTEIKVHHLESFSGKHFGNAMEVDITKLIKGRILSNCYKSIISTDQN